MLTRVVLPVPVRSRRPWLLMVSLDVGVGHSSSRRALVILVGPVLAARATAAFVLLPRSSYCRVRPTAAFVLLPRSSTVEVAPSPPAVRLWPELALQPHQAPDPGAVGAGVGLDLGGRLADSGQVDAEQLRAPLQRRCDRPS
jgi:hypothetical protein